MEEKSALPSSSSSVAVTEKMINEKSNHFPTYNPKKRVYNREEQTILAYWHQIPVNHDFDFGSKTANCINQVIPMEKYLVKKYDNAKMKAFPNDKILHDEFSILSAQIEIKLLIWNDEFKNYIKSTEMLQIMESASFTQFPCGKTDRKQYDEILFKLTFIRALRSGMCKERE